eukprot:UN04026
MTHNISNTTIVSDAGDPEDKDTLRDGSLQKVGRSKTAFIGRANNIQVVKKCENDNEETAGEIDEEQKKLNMNIQ